MGPGAGDGHDPSNKFGFLVQFVEKDEIAGGGDLENHKCCNCLDILLGFIFFISNNHLGTWQFSKGQKLEFHLDFFPSLFTLLRFICLNCTATHILHTFTLNLNYFFNINLHIISIKFTISTFYINF